VVDTRDCAQCGALFTPRREHARFCSSGCRAAWNRARTGDPTLELTALYWSVNAMREATEVLPRLPGGDRRRALTAVGEAVWSVTIVDATLMRHHPVAYDAAAAALTRSPRRVVEETLAGLRFVRNRIGQKVDLAELVGPGAPDSDAATTPVTDWVWKSVPGPDRASRSSRAHTWEAARYRAYQAQLVGRTVGESVERAAAFLQRMADDTLTPVDAHSTRRRA
jgi:hypothetical protein